MKFEFIPKMAKDNLLDIRINVDGRNSGIIVLTEQEWNNLSFLLKGGTYMDGEAEIKIHINSQTSAFAQGE